VRANPRHPKGCDRTGPAPSVELLAVAKAMPSESRLGWDPVAPQ